MQALWMVLGALMFALMAIGVKFASDSFNTFELVFYRGLVGAIVMLGVSKARGISLATKVPGMHAWRGFVGVTSLTAWFYAIAHLPVATAMTLNYMSSVWVAVFVMAGAILYGKQQGLGWIAVAVFCGFGGVVLILQPSFAKDQWLAVLVGASSGLVSSLAYLQVAALGRVGEPEDRTVFYFAVVTTVVGLVGMLSYGVSPGKVWNNAAVWWIVPIGAFATMGQWCMTRAYSKGSQLVVASLQYTGIVFSALLGWILLDETLDLHSWLGMSIIVISGIGATFLRSKTLPTQPAMEDRS
jgi:S-adenosylmethionine uptake transporter